MKLELKHLAPYLPYEIGINYNGFATQYLREDTLHFVDLCLNRQWKLILRPLSDLNKDIYHNGQNFVPVEVLSYIDLDGICIIDIPHVSVNLYNTLLKWHFDIFGLIEARLAIDINTLNK